MADIAVIGGGIVGLATARAIVSRFPDRSLVLLDKEPDWGAHQTGHNSGVIHSGVYYRPGSLKARLCVAGRRRLIQFIEARGLPIRRCGKLILASSTADLPRLEELERRARANGVEGVSTVDPAAIRACEPEAWGVAGLRIDGTAITDYRAVARSLADALTDEGVELRRGTRVIGGSVGEHRAELATTAGPISTRYVVNCGGLHSDRIAQLLGVRPSVRIVPFRGEYHTLSRAMSERIQGLIYPVPDPDLPFLGVHLTKRLGGDVEAGPNAVLAFAREGYTRSTVNVRDLAESLLYPGFLRMARRLLGTGLYENYRSLDRQALSRDLRRLVPDLSAEDLRPFPGGVRAQAVAPDGALVDDFVIQTARRSLHVLNAPSPGATASLAIGDHIANQVPTTLPD